MVISFLGHRTLYGADDLFEAVKNAIVKNTIFDEKVTFFVADTAILMICVHVFVGR